MNHTTPNFEPARLRQTILRMAKEKAGHLGCAFSLVEIVSALYGRGLLHYNPTNPDDPDRDLLALSKGHGAMALYACFYELGWVTDEQLNHYFEDGSDLFGLLEADAPGAEVSGGSLGHGLPVAVGMAYGLQRRGSSRKIVCIVGDGEMNEGSMWESLLFAGHHRLANLTIIVDANAYQAMGLTRDILDMEPLADKFHAFKFDCIACNGHDVDAVTDALRQCFSSDGPAVLVARTIKGAGVDFMEGNNLWHYTRLTDGEQRNQAWSQVRADRTPGDTSR